MWILFSVHYYNYEIHPTNGNERKNKHTTTGSNMSLTIHNLVPQRPFCYLNFISMAKPQKFVNETYDAHVLVFWQAPRHAESKISQKKVDPEPAKIHVILTSQS